jgi:two-component system LytT family response regulator
MNTQRIKTVIIDDEKRARESISDMITLYCPELDIIGNADSVLSGLEIIKTKKPDLIFLDIKMQDGTGFDLLNRIENKNFALIFLTAYDEYAVKAFKFSAIDYLLKPLDPDELISAVNKAVENNKTNISILIENLNSIKKDSKKIVLKTTDSIHLVNICDIIRLESTGNYTNFYLTNQKPIMVSHTLKDYDEILNEYGFFRVHQSHLVNLQHIIRLDKADGGVIILTNNEQAPISTRKKDAFLKALSKF